MRSDRAQGAFVSGGFDSSAIACLMRELSDSQMHSFSYRCAAKSYDESAYARIVADSCHFDHHEVVFQPKDIENIKTVVQFEDEPLCNLGITVATFLLGREAHNISSRVFSGHGGDELFGGHPVYIADKMAGLADRIPRAVLYPLTAAFRRLPDSDKKLNLTVKLKRFSESLAYPAELGTYRWRIYYGQDELNLLLSPSLSLDQREFPALFSDVLDLYTEAGDRDVLNRSLYVDFQTEVGFHLRRMNLVRHFNVQPLFPLLDYRLVEYAASIPPDLKLKGYSDAKYIERKVIDGIVPDPILNRKDKIGHSIPFKNWLRAEPAVTNFVREILFDGKLSSRGYFNPTTMQQLWDDHQTAKRNNSHRLWTLCVLELWLAANNI
jgi:asparagine synthase (glutamine-hydrolysing)